MNTLQNVREAQQMWERKFQNAGRERIQLNCGKRGSLGGVFGRVFGGAARPTATRDSVGTSARKHRATA